ncbi:hypothetical protein CMI49_00640 [Candidatus Pacearchaeota archaeon]|jgi:hypothetical protein|nr:hypothetical protein [Candidatus Pacearchaeota archaeon]|tara:strand:+ start:20 stop:352 length:333 start_codon:yes stop_codon:yes gene_type:complete
MVKSSHRKALEKIAACPSRFGFEDILATIIEANLYNRKGQIVAQPDLILYSSEGDIYVIEYKSNGDKKLIERAKDQLYNSVQWFSKYTSIIPKTKIINGTNYKGKFNKKQ